MELTLSWSRVHINRQRGGGALAKKIFGITADKFEEFKYNFEEPILKREELFDYEELQLCDNLLPVDKPKIPESARAMVDLYFSEENLTSQKVE